MPHVALTDTATPAAVAEDHAKGEVRTPAGAVVHGPLGTGRGLHEEDRGGADAVLDQAGPKAWQTAFPAASLRVRSYPGEGHDVQYRHLDKILLDIAGYGDKILICKDNINTMVATEAAAVDANTTLGLCAWSGS